MHIRCGFSSVSFSRFFLCGGVLGSAIWKEINPWVEQLFSAQIAIIFVSISLKTCFGCSKESLSGSFDDPQHHYYLEASKPHLLTAWLRLELRLLFFFLYVARSRRLRMASASWRPGPSLTHFGQGISELTIADKESNVHVHQYLKLIPCYHLNMTTGNVYCTVGRDWCIVWPMRRFKL